MTDPSELTVQVLAEAHKTIRAGAPGLSDQTCNVLAGIIARKVSSIYAHSHPTEQAGTEGAELVAELLRYFVTSAHAESREGHASWVESHSLVVRSRRFLAALSSSTEEKGS